MWKRLFTFVSIWALTMLMNGCSGRRNWVIDMNDCRDKFVQSSGANEPTIEACKTLQECMEGVTRGYPYSFEPQLHVALFQERETLGCPKDPEAALLWFEKAHRTQTDAPIPLALKSMLLSKLNRDEADEVADHAIRLFDYALSDTTDTHPNFVALLQSNRLELLYDQIKRALRAADHMHAVEILLDIEDPTDNRHDGLKLSDGALFSLLTDVIHFAVSHKLPFFERVSKWMQSWGTTTQSQVPFLAPLVWAYATLGGSESARRNAELLGILKERATSQKTRAALTVDSVTDEISRLYQNKGQNTERMELWGRSRVLSMLYGTYDVDAAIHIADIDAASQSSLADTGCRNMGVPSLLGSDDCKTVRRAAELFASSGSGHQGELMERKFAEAMHLILEKQINSIATAASKLRLQPLSALSVIRIGVVLPTCDPRQSLNLLENSILSHLDGSLFMPSTVCLRGFSALSSRRRAIDIGGEMSTLARAESVNHERLHVIVAIIGDGGTDTLIPAFDRITTSTPRLSASDVAFLAHRVSPVQIAIGSASDARARRYIDFQVSTPMWTPPESSPHWYERFAFLSPGLSPVAGMEAHAYGFSQTRGMLDFGAMTHPVHMNTDASMFWSLLDENVTVAYGIHELGPQGLREAARRARNVRRGAVACYNGAVEDIGRNALQSWVRAVMAVKGTLKIATNSRLRHRRNMMRLIVDPIVQRERPDAPTVVVEPLYPLGNRTRTVSDSICDVMLTPGRQNMETSLETSFVGVPIVAVLGASAAYRVQGSLSESLFHECARARDSAVLFARTFDEQASLLRIAMVFASKDAKTAMTLKQRKLWQRIQADAKRCPRQASLYNAARWVSGLEITLRLSVEATLAASGRSWRPERNGNQRAHIVTGPLV